MLKKLYYKWQDFSAKMKELNISSYAAGIAFFFFLSVVPMLMLICTIIPYTPITEKDFVDAVMQVVPEQTRSLVTGLIADIFDKSASKLSIAIIAILWSAAKGVMALMSGLNTINRIEEKRNYFVIRTVASLYTFAMLLVVIVSLVINVFGNQLVDLLVYQIPTLNPMIAFLMHFRFITVWVVSTLLFATIYALVPVDRTKIRYQIPGAMFTAAGWSIFSWAFSLYIKYFNGYSIYGSLSVIVIILFWMYFCMYIVLIGAYLNWYFSNLNRKVANTGTTMIHDKKALRKNKRIERKRKNAEVQETKS